jgi:UDP-N-acetylglucosamine diphosphorylase/glucosamine-1-phosphate N-acetyltransferase
MPKPAKCVILFEDEAAQTLEPLTLTRPVWELQCGITTLREKILRAFTMVQHDFHVREYLKRAISSSTNRTKLSGGDCLWVNGALLPGENFSSALNLDPGSAWVKDDRILTFRGAPPESWQAGTMLQLRGFDLKEAPAQTGKLLDYPWRFVHAMNGEIEREARQLRALGENRGEVHRSTVLINPGDIFIGTGAKLAPGVVIDATLGPIVIDERVEIGAHAVIEGPCYIGLKTQIKPLAHIRGSSFGEESRVGGEVSVSIIQGYTNKQHGGFLGHSYIGSWCNLGSGTETSNLKNNYSPVKVQVGEKLVDSGELFVGLTMGDHSKTAIGMVFNTGTVVGVGCNIFGAGFPPRYIPSFHWGGAEKLARYPFNRTLEIAREVMPRRGKTLADEDIEILRWIFDHRSQSPKIEKE